MTEAQPYSSDTIEFASAVLGLSRRITVWIPDGARSPARAPVLYLNDGQNLFDSSRAYTGVTWRVAETAAWLIERRLIPPLVIVGIDHGELRERANTCRSRTIAIHLRAIRWRLNMRRS